MADISKITLPTGTTYDIKDARARELIGSLSGAVTYLGTTTTALTDGCSTSPISVGGVSVTPKAGDVAVYGNSEFVWSDTESKWREFGSTGSLKALAFKDNVSASYTPAGSVAISKGTGTANYTPAGTVSKPTVTVEMNTASVKPFGSAGTLPSFTASVSGETLSLSFSAGTLPSAGTAVNVATSVKSATASQPTFTGTGVELKAAFTGTAATITSK